MSAQNAQLYAGPPQVLPDAARTAADNAALRLITRLDEDLTCGIRHFRDTTGWLLHTLNEDVWASSLPEEV